MGGGAAGCSAALVLGRCRRSVLVCDDGQPRNAVARGVHGFLTRDGVPPAEFLRIAREQALAYPTVRWRKAHVRDVRRIPGGFRLELADGSEVTGATLLLATGLVDELPPIPRVREFWGHSVFVCPFCDAWEVRDQRFVVLGTCPALYGFTLELTQWSRELIVATNGCDVLTPAQRAQLGRRRIPVVTAPATELEGRDGQIEAVRFADGTRIETRVLFLTTEQHQRSPLAERLGCPIDAEGAVPVPPEDPGAADRVWVAGNAASGLQMAVVAAAEGVQAAHAINERLVADALGTG